MSLELLKTIEQAEAQADSIRQDASRRARELVVEADKRGGLVRDADYGAQIALTILLPQPEEAAFRKALQELSAGSLAPETTGTELRGVRIR